MTPTAQIELLHVPDCPLVDHVRATVEQCLKETGIDAAVHEHEGDYASPTLLINGNDVTGAPPQAAVCCRLDLPSHQQILAALNTNPS